MQALPKVHMSPSLAMACCVAFAPFVVAAFVITETVCTSIFEFGRMDQERVSLGLKDQQHVKI